MSTSTVTRPNPIPTTATTPDGSNGAGTSGQPDVLVAEKAAPARRRGITPGRRTGPQPAPDPVPSDAAAAVCRQMMVLLDTVLALPDTLADPRDRVDAHALLHQILAAPPTTRSKRDIHSRAGVTVIPSSRPTAARQAEIGKALAWRDVLGLTGLPEPGETRRGQGR